jgi:23S rRNA pseudouridine1911/1915/1917 synthase
VYGTQKSCLPCPRQFLHAHRLGFHRPSDGQWVVLESPLPADLLRVLSYLTDAS